MLQISLNCNPCRQTPYTQLIEYHDDRKLDKTQLNRFATCDYIDEEHHIILKGATGNGKTYIACALGNAACRKFKSVRYVRMPELLDELTIWNPSSSPKSLLYQAFQPSANP